MLYITMCFLNTPNKMLHRAAIPLHSIVAGELGVIRVIALKIQDNGYNHE